MSNFIILKNQRGALLLIFVVITALGGTIVAVLGPQLAPLAERVQRPTNQAILAAGDTSITQPTNEEIQEAKDLVVTVGQLGLATGGIINSIASVPSGGVKDLIGTGIATMTDHVQSDMVSRGSNPVPTTSNPLPPDVQAPVTCSSSSLSSCTSRSSCSNAGGDWNSNNTCSSSLVACDNDHLYLCVSNTCGGADGYWYDNACNENYILGAWNYTGVRPDGVERGGTMNFSSGNTFSYTIFDADGQSNGSGSGLWALTGETLSLSAGLAGIGTISGDQTSFTYDGHGTFRFTRPK